MERLSVPSIKESGTSIKYDVNCTRQSFLVENGASVILVRELGHSLEGLSAAEEIARRRESLKLYERFLPDFTLPTQHVILQGTREDETKVPLLGRFSPKVEDVKALTDIRTREILSNPKLLRDIARINFGNLKMVLKEGKIPDSGGRGGFGSSLPRPLASITTRLTSNNILVGKDSSGDTKVFCDPDWFTEPAGGAITKTAIKAKYTCLYAARCTFFYVASKVQEFF